MRREHWSKFGLILASIGSAIGLGNIWRFSYLVGENGGGAFLIPYLIGVIFFGLPIMLLELSIGRKYQGSVLTCFKKANPKLKYLGLIPILTVLLVLSYYLVIAGWTLAYFVFSFVKFPNFNMFTSSSSPIIFFVITLIIGAIIIHKGIKKGIENTCKYLLPLLIVLLMVLLLRALTLPNAIEGVKFYLTPNLPLLKNPRIWLLAIGQAFFSLSAGTGIFLTFGSYAKKKENVPVSVIEIATADTFVALLAGFVIFPIVFAFGSNPAAGVELAFITLPQIFGTMFLGQLFGAIFFLLLFIGALTSILSMIEIGVTTFIDDFKFKRNKSTIAISIFLILVGLPSALSYAGVNLTVLGKPFLDIMDYLFGSLFTPLSALIICLVFAWSFKPKTLLQEINKNVKTKVPFFVIYLLRYIIPIALIGLFIIELS